MNLAEDCIPSAANRHVIKSNQTLCVAGETKICGQV